MGFMIEVNGRPREVGSPLSYQDGVRFGLWRDGDSVTYEGARSGDKRRLGMLFPEGSVELEDGMRFSAAYTGNA